MSFCSGCSLAPVFCIQRDGRPVRYESRKGRGTRPLRIKGRTGNPSYELRKGRGTRPLRKPEVFSIAKLTHQLNEDIQDKEIRLIGADGTQLCIISSAAALALAEEQELDLVKISPTAKPPVCKIMDYGKFRFDQMKKEKEAKKNQHVVELKEIRMSPGIDTNDLNTKMRNAIKFLKEGNRVKVSVRFRGREMAHTNIGEDLLVQFAEGCKEVANLEKNPKLEGRFMYMFLSPKQENKK